MRIFYGSEDVIIDVTTICFSKLMHNNIIVIPSGDDDRACIFTDPIFRTLKKIFISNIDLTEYDHMQTIYINTVNNTITAVNQDDMNENVANLHSQIQLKHGSFDEELPEQKMALRFLTGDEKVLEIGGNIGRNSLIISHILKDSSNLVTLECDPNIANQLRENRDLNGFNFHIENSALSKRKLIQKGWNTIVSDIVLDGFHEVSSITYEQLKNKYNINFDTLVLDCEGAFYYILMDMPEILDNIKLIIMENDYWEIEKKQFIDDILIKNNFYRVYKEAGGWGPCYGNFFETWKR